ncbi:peptidoglycan-binding protein [Cellulomonas sp. ATA003]|uniref:peptidoglycan-binding domain-containing protein n=1 Tax=Cellulomonas sp. ATA003 TaxID=3073064 RepID=UPI00287378E2|nr:peptidoglycan-binding protein [Cellulomonas sp. ATA003]WNB85558.1 peptidoglycan-binding protein [Cellulomonas sp. ATA003]
MRDWQGIVNVALRLGQLDHPRIAEDGVFGPQTHRATVALQRVARVAEDGVVGPRTRLAVGWLLEGIPD